MLEPKVGSIASYYGSNRMLAEKVGEQFIDCNFVGIPFAGGMSEIRYIKSRVLLVNDLNRHIINLAMVMASDDEGPKLEQRLNNKIFHPDELEAAQTICRIIDNGTAIHSYLDWAEAYFVCSWMTRHGSAGTNSEFTTGISTRWNGEGGGSGKHFWSAVESIPAWRELMRRCDFTVLDFREFLKKCKDQKECGIYCDPPFFGPGDKYKYSFSLQDHKDLAKRLNEFNESKIVCRFYNIPLVHELYPEPSWKYLYFEGRKQTNDKAPEILVVKNG